MENFSFERETAKLSHSFKLTQKNLITIELYCIRFANDYEDGNSLLR